MLWKLEIYVNHILLFSAKSESNPATRLYNGFDR